MLVPVYCIILFVILYLTAASLYPGGSDIDHTSKGFSWLHNYWCELMASKAQNGGKNTARPVAIIAMSILALGLCFFWFITADLFARKKAGYYLVRYTGIASALVWVFFLAHAHDTVVNLSGLFGVIAMTFVIIGLYRNKWYWLVSLGVICLLLCVVNNYVYHTGQFFQYLAIIQKISFIIFLYWFCAVSVQLYKKN